MIEKSIVKKEKTKDKTLVEGVWQVNKKETVILRDRLKMYVKVK